VTFTAAYYDANRIERTIEAASVEDAIASSEALRAAEGGYWEGCDEESFGTDGFVEVLDSTGRRAYDSGPASIRALFDAVIDRRTRLGQFGSQRRPLA
jgi:hypothetical protein